MVEAPDGTLYTRYHLPFEMMFDGEVVPTQKAEWGEDVWLRLHSKLKSRYQNDTVPVHSSSLPRGGELYRSPLGPNDDGVFRDLSAVEHNLSGLHLDHLPLSLMAHPVYKLNWMWFSGIHLSKEDGLIANFNTRLINCYAGYVSIIEQSSGAGLEFVNCLIPARFRLIASSFSNLVLEKCTLEGFEIRDSTLSTLIISSDIDLPDHCSLYHSTVKEKADLRGSGAALVGAFDSVKMPGRLLIDNETDGRPADEVFRRDVIEVALGKIRDIRKSSYMHRSPAELRQLKSQFFRHIEGGALFLKTKMREEGFEELAHRYYRYELWARTYNPSTDMGTRWLLTIYRWCSQYGYNVTRPLLWILALSFYLSFFYLFSFTITQGWTLPRVGIDFSAFSYFSDAWSFSLNRIAPVIPWGAGIPVSPGTFEYTIKAAGGLTGLVVHFIGITQTIVSTCLFFLTGLAARRRFRMSD